MSREDAIKSTGEMAENYLGAVEEFENESNVQMYRVMKHRPSTAKKVSMEEKAVTMD